MEGWKERASTGLVGVCLLAGSLAGLLPGEIQAKRFEPLDVFELEYAAEPQITSDGARIVYERRSLDIMTDSVRSALWTINADGSEHRPLLADGASYTSPRISPDDGRIAYVTNVADKPQLHVLWLDDGRSALVSNLRYAPKDLAWSPDGRTLAFTMDVPLEREPLVKAPKAPEGAEWAPAVKVIDTVIYRFDGRGFLTPSRTHIFTVPAEGGSARQITNGDFNHPGPLSWMPDSRGIVFAANREPDWEYDRVGVDVYRVDAVSGELLRLTHTGTARNPVVSPDGRRIAFLSSAKEKIPYRLSRLAVMNADGTEPRLLTPELDRSVAEPSWAGTGNGLYAAYNNRGKRQLAYVPLRGTLEDLTDRVGGASLGRPYTGGSHSVSPNGVAVFTLADPSRPADLAVLRRGRETQLTRLNEDALGAIELGRLEELNYTSSVGDVPVQGWYLLPPDYEPGKRYPLILELHGGPHSSYGPVFSAEMQLMAARGYMVFYDNYRGSTSYGEDFALLLQYRYSSPDEFGDHMAGIDRLIDMGIADPDALYVTGGSAGGIATLYAIGLTDRFRAAAAAKPIANWISKTLTGDIYTYQIDHQFPGTPWAEFEHYWQRSPLSLMDNVSTPTLLITGEEDYRTPISETEQYYQALKLKRVDTVMVRVPEASHGIASKPSHLIAKVENILGWFARYGKE